LWIVAYYKKWLFAPGRLVGSCGGWESSTTSSSTKGDGVVSVKLAAAAAAYVSWWIGHLIWFDPDDLSAWLETLEDVAKLVWR
jgi:hypothetical protein